MKTCFSPAKLGNFLKVFKRRIYSYYHNNSLLHNLLQKYFSFLIEDYVVTTVIISYFEIIHVVDYIS
jgi:hypothetical protein